MVKERVMPAKYYVADVGLRNAVLLMIVRSLDANVRVFLLFRK